MKFDEAEVRLGDGSVVMVVVAEDTDARRDFYLGVVGIGCELQNGDFGGPWRQTLDLSQFFRLLRRDDPAVMSVVAPKAFGIAELHTLFQRPAEENIVLRKQLVQRGGVFIELRVIKIRGQRIQ